MSLKFQVLIFFVLAIGLFAYVLVRTRGGWRLGKTIGVTLLGVALALIGWAVAVINTDASTNAGAGGGDEVVMQLSWVALAVLAVLAIGVTEWTRARGRSSAAVLGQ